jgi:hypothetical protein
MVELSEVPPFSQRSLPLTVQGHPTNTVQDSYGLWLPLCMNAAATQGKADRINIFLWYLGRTAPSQPFAEFASLDGIAGGVSNLHHVTDSHDKAARYVIRNQPVVRREFDNRYFLGLYEIAPSIIVLTTPSVRYGRLAGLGGRGLKTTMLVARPTTTRIAVFLLSLARSINPALRPWPLVLGSHCDE